MRNLAGRFSLIEKVDNVTVVGLLGNITAKSLSHEEMCFIAGFYDVKGNNRSFQVVDKYSATDGKSVNSYNSFLIIIKED